MSDNMELVDKSWNYLFFKDERVIFHPDLKPFINTHGDWEHRKMFDPEPYKDKIGIVIECDSDLHAFAMGSWYHCLVDFEGTLVETFSGAFLTNYSFLDDRY